MRLFVLLLLMALGFNGLCTESSALSSDVSLPHSPATNLVADPFAANARKGGEQPTQNLPAPRFESPPGSPNFGVLQSHPLPVLPNFRLVMIRGGKTAWLSVSDTPKNIVQAKHGETVYVGAQSFYVEITEEEVRFLSKPKGKVLWVGNLIGSTGPNTGDGVTPFVPPLSAGVNPGLRAVPNQGSSLSSQKP